MSELRDAALEYVAGGLRVFPVKPRGKEPLTQRGFHDASSDPERIVAWWARWPDANIGMPTGEPNGIVVIDEDTGKGGRTSLDTLEQQHGKLPRTAETLTRGGGRHLIFRRPASGIRNSAAVLGPGLDIRGDGGYIVVPPSVHQTGRLYQWTRRIDLADMPGWLVATNGNGKAAPQVETIIRSGQRNTELASLAGTLRRRGLGETEIAAALLETNRLRCKPPLPETEVRRIAVSYATREAAAPIGDPLLNSAGEPVDEYRAATPFIGLTHAEVLALEFEAERFLIEDLIPGGQVGTIAGVPETHKSWLAQAIGTRVAVGKGKVLGRQVQCGAPVGYIWQDDSTREEAERIKLFDRVHESPPDLPIRWFLNEGIKLPDDLARLRATVEEHGLVLLIIDSFYNVLFGHDLKDETAEQVVAALKREITDPTGCTVLIVDHMPWATDTNRQRLRAYGGVFKGAATRFGIYIDAAGKKLWIEARGNNMRGFQRTLAEWDDDLLELRLIDSDDRVGDDDYEHRILDYLAEHPGALTKDLDSITGKDTELRAARQRLLETGAITNSKAPSSGRGNPGMSWNLTSQAKTNLVPLPGTDK